LKLYFDLSGTKNEYFSRRPPIQSGKKEKTMNNFQIRKIRIIMLLLFILAFSAAAQEVYEIRIDLGLEEIFTLIEEGRLDEIPDGQVVLVEGNISSRLVLQQDPYLAEVTILKGYWEGASILNRYYAVIQLEGEKFSSAVPARPSRRPPPEELPAKARILVAGRFVGTREFEGFQIPVFKAEYIRVMQ
jgi:hypothetical protein